MHRTKLISKLHFPPGSFTILLFSGVGFLTMGLIGPVLPIYMNSLGIEVRTIGIVYGIAALTSATGAIIWGRHLDLGRIRLAMVVNLAGFGITIAFFLLARSTILLGIVYTIQGFFFAGFTLFGRWYMGVYASPKSKVLGMAAVAATLRGFEAVGSYLGGLTAEYLGYQSNLILASLISFVLAFAMLARYRRMKILPPPEKTVDDPASVPSGSLLLNRPLLLISIVSTFRVTCNGIIYTFLSLLVVQTVNASDAWVGILFAVLSLVNFIVVFPLARMADLRGKRHFMSAGLALMTAAFLGMTFGTTYLAFIGAAALMSLGSAFYAPASYALLSEKTAQHEQGRLLGAMRAVEDTGFIIGPVVGGLLWDHVGTRAPFFFGAVLVAMGLLVWVLFQKKALAIVPHAG
jgi:MFS family permease